LTSFDGDVIIAHMSPSRRFIIISSIIIAPAGA
jgi:hypothetical protein